MYRPVAVLEPAVVEVVFEELAPQAVSLLLEVVEMLPRLTLLPHRRAPPE
jgi:hypothetical protein